MTNDLVEKMIGHQTRLVQEMRRHWHAGEDHRVSGVLGLARAMDRLAVALMALVPRGWLFLGLLGLTPSFALGNISTTKLAVGVGGVLLAFRALQRLAMGLSQVAGTVVAWRQISPLYGSADRPIAHGISTHPTSFGPETGISSNAPALLEAHNVRFSYRERGVPVLRECSLRIRQGDRIMVEGSSGSGKSTLASIMAGLRVAETGLLLLRGLDRQTVGFGSWRRCVAAAPQFHENHVLTGTFAFNLLMGGRWPPRLEDFERSEALCRELGLGDLLRRMPSGLLQAVGEGGWQLSHGERSRLYIARALLQNAELVILDESFAALDPENLSRALRCVLERASTVLIAAHP